MVFNICTIFNLCFSLGNITFKVLQIQNQLFYLCFNLGDVTSEVLLFQNQLFYHVFMLLCKVKLIRLVLCILFNKLLPFKKVSRLLRY